MRAFAPLNPQGILETAFGGASTWVNDFTAAILLSTYTSGIALAMPVPSLPLSADVSSRCPRVLPDRLGDPIRDALPRVQEQR